MNQIDLAGKIDLTLLKSKVTKDDINKICFVAIRYGFRSVCVQPIWVRECFSTLTKYSLPVICVNDYPLGVGGATVKIATAWQSVNDGARENDIVVNMDAFADHNFHLVKEEVNRVVKIISTKVIVEIGNWDKYELEYLCKLLSETEAFCLKTSTGLGPKTSLDEKARAIEVMKNAAPNMLIKASEDIKTKDDAIFLLNAGADIIGSSSGVKIVCDEKEY